jgi:hypothetical protein
MFAGLDMSKQVIALLVTFTLLVPVQAQHLDKQKLLDAETFWDNRDWDWYKANIPFFDCPDAEILTTYYYRWELVTKHLTYGSPRSGYSFTEFIDRPFWSGTYGAISCPAGHQLYEVRWLRDPRFASDYSKYWFHTPGAQPRNYSCWIADAVWAAHRVHPDDGFIKDFLPDMIRNFEAWEKKHYTPEAGLFWQTGHDDGMEYNINSRQTKDIVRGAPGYRPSLNSYMFADALAIARVAELAGDRKLAKGFSTKAANIKANVQKQLWDPKRNFFLHMAKQDETVAGRTVKAGSLIYQTGKYAGTEHGREEIGYIPWQFNLADAGYEAAWKYLMDPNYFYSKYGPTTVERHDPLFHLSKTCCWWSGQSWPYATTQTLAAMASLLNNYSQNIVTKKDYFTLLKTYTLTQRKNGRPYIAEAANPDSGSWEGHDSYNHSEHYFHSGYNDLIITGLVGLRPRDDDSIEVNPLAPVTWDWFGLDNLKYKNHEVAIVWDRDGSHFGKGKGLSVIVDGKQIARSDKLSKITAELSSVADARAKRPSAWNFAVNNEGRYYPRAVASFANPRTPVQNVNDGNYWYHRDPPNRWTCEGSPNPTDWCAVEFGIKRRIHTVKLYLLDDGDGIAAPEHFELEAWKGKEWSRIGGQNRSPSKPIGHRANVVVFPELETDKIRAVFTHAGKNRTGLTEFEAWGDATIPYIPPRSPEGNLALNETGKGFPKASASYTSRFDKVEAVNDGRIFFRPTPANRWTSYESPNVEDWLEIDFGAGKAVGRVELYIYDDGGGVQAPRKYTLQWWDGSTWKNVDKVTKSPEKPTGGVKNTITFPAVETSKMRVVFTHQRKSRSGLTEIEMWRE